MPLLRWAAALALVLMPSLADAQAAASVQAPAGYAPMQAPCVKQTDGSCVPVSAANPLPVSGGGGGGTDPRVAQGSTTSGQPGSLVQGAVVAGDQAFSSGTTNPLTMTTTGRLKVGLSSAGNVTPGSRLATTTTADLIGCQYLASPPTWSDTWTGSITCDASGAQRVSLTGTPTVNIGTAPQLNVNLAAQSGPIGIAASALPLPSGAATAAAQAPYSAYNPLTVGTSATAGRGWQAVCTAAGNVALVLSGGATDVLPVNAGLTMLPLAVTQVSTSGTTATCSYANLG